MMNIFGKHLLNKSTRLSTNLAVSTHQQALMTLLFTSNSSASMMMYSQSSHMMIKGFSTNNRMGVMRNFSSQTATSHDTSAEILQEQVPLVNEEEVFVKKLRERYPGVKPSRLSKQVKALDIERDVQAAEDKLINEFGFLKEEISFIMRYNPKFILVDNQKAGINTLKSFFVDKKGFQMDSIRTMAVRYPYVLSKTEEEFTQYFETMKGQGISDEEAMRALLECPKLISRKDLEK